ncbi:penicillin-binding protein 2 [Nocardioides immobilis]|uniref:Penicillin-binding protein 2 n=1 Tax=Nocardioides immobilis TaxID=2049295 RepID=A0A417Y805_9ACTN|nr:penicillin-binding protein 2 [Nocardioides immobilis]RHW28651.1 penicillin-binding protein 2 [Nocardioides immobilis]
MSASTSSSSHRSRLRLIVIQALAFSLLATLAGRLYYLQVVTGEEYQGKAASQSVRDIVVQPERGLIVDAMGRPLVTNRLTWVASIDRTLLGRMEPRVRRALLKRISRVIDVEPRQIARKLALCGTEGAKEGVCWNGSPYQPVPVAQDLDDATALRINEQPEDFPGVVVVQQSVRDYPQPYGINAAHLLGYLSPITKDELEEAEVGGDTSVNGASVVGRAGVEKEYDAWLRGQPGYQRVKVNANGEVIGEEGDIQSQPGDTLVTSIDAKVQGIVERQLNQMITTARSTIDPVTGRLFEADSGAAVVMEADTGRVIAMASQPTYDPAIWAGGITQKQLKRLYSEAAGTPLLGRALQGQFAPGSTWKPFMTAGALTHGYGTDTRLNCSSAFRVGNRDFKNYESGAYGYISFADALKVSCNTFFYRIGYDYWQRFGSDVADVDAKDPLVEQALDFGFGSATRIDIPGESSGRIADREWKRDYYRSMKDYYCGISSRPQDAPQNKGISDFVYKFAYEFCVEGYAYRAGDAVNFAIGQGDTIVTPLQLARAYAAIGNGGILWEPRVGKAIVSPDGEVIREIAPSKGGEVGVPDAVLHYIDEALKNVSREGTLAWKLGGFPLDDVQIRAKTGSAEVYGKQSTGWVASYNEDYVVVMMISQGGTGSGSTGDGIRKIWESLYGIEGETVRPDKAAIPGTVPPERLPIFARDGSILPPARLED